MGISNRFIKGQTLFLGIRTTKKKDISLTLKKPQSTWGEYPNLLR